MGQKVVYLSESRVKLTTFTKTQRYLVIFIGKTFHFLKKFVLKTILIFTGASSGFQPNQGKNTKF